MVLYKCEDCSFQTTNKTDYTRHKSRKMKCGSTFDEETEKKISAKCKHCSSEFTSINNMYRHQKYRCTMKDEIREEKTMPVMAPLTITNNIHIHNHTITNITNITNNVTTNITNNIVINSYGLEDTIYMTSDKIKELLCKGGSCMDEAISGYVKAVHFDEDYPENHNIAITNKKVVYGYKYVNGIWETVLANNLTRSVYKNARSAIIRGCSADEEMLERMNLSGSVQAEIKNFLDDLLDDSREDGIMGDIVMVILNNTKKLNIKPQNSKI
jgi:hypothetical protein